MIAYASSHTLPAMQFVSRINEAIFFPLITLLTVVALVVFLYGLLEYVLGASSEDKRSQGQKHILWGLVGLLVMLGAYAILTIAANTFGIDTPDPIRNSPFAPQTSPSPNPRPDGLGATLPDGSAPEVSPTPTPRPDRDLPGSIVCGTSERCPDFDGELKGVGAMGTLRVSGAGATIPTIEGGEVIVSDNRQVQILHHDGRVTKYFGVDTNLEVGDLIEKNATLGTVLPTSEYADYELGSGEGVYSVTEFSRELGVDLFD